MCIEECPPTVPGPRVPHTFLGAGPNIIGSNECYNSYVVIPFFAAVATATVAIGNAAD